MLRAPVGAAISGAEVITGTIAHFPGSGDMLWLPVTAAQIGSDIKQSAAAMHVTALCANI